MLGVCTPFGIIGYTEDKATTPSTIPTTTFEAREVPQVAACENVEAHEQPTFEKPLESQSITLGGVAELLLTLHDAPDCFVTHLYYTKATQSANRSKRSHRSSRYPGYYKAPVNTSSASKPGYSSLFTGVQQARKRQADGPPTTSSIPPFKYRKINNMPVTRATGAKNCPPVITPSFLPLSVGGLGHFFTREAIARQREMLGQQGKTNHKQAMHQSPFTVQVFDIKKGPKAVYQMYVSDSKHQVLAQLDQALNHLVESACIRNYSIVRITGLRRELNNVFITGLEPVKGALAPVNKLGNPQTIAFGVPQAVYNSPSQKLTPPIEVSVASPTPIVTPSLSIPTPSPQVTLNKTRYQCPLRYCTTQFTTFDRLMTHTKQCKKLQGAVKEDRQNHPCGRSCSGNVSSSSKLATALGTCKDKTKAARLILVKMGEETIQGHTYSLVGLFSCQCRRWLSVHDKNLYALSRDFNPKKSTFLIEQKLKDGKMFIRLRTGEKYENAVAFGGQCLKITSDIAENQFFCVHNVNALEELLEPIFGMDKLKQRLRQFRKKFFWELALKAQSATVKSTDMMSMAFMGSPGTGKTMMARLIARMMHRLGIVTSSNVLEVQRSDLVGKYVGHTAAKTKNVMQLAQGGVLFLDEAYRLSDSGSSNDFGKEAIEELMTAMNPDLPPEKRIVFIFAGYKDKMNQFMRTNPGLFRRTPHIFDFPDYEPEELVEILKEKISKKGYFIDPKLTDKKFKDIIVNGTTPEARSKVNAGLTDVLIPAATRHLVDRLDLGVDFGRKLLELNEQDFRLGIAELPKVDQSESGLPQMYS